MEKIRNIIIDSADINRHTNQVQPIQIVFTDGQFIKVFPSQYSQNIVEILTEPVFTRNRPNSNRNPER